MTNEEAIEILQEEHDWVQEPCYVMNAIKKAIEALRSADHFPNLTKMAPLTLDQLRQMDGKPVWVEDLKNHDRSAWRLIYWDRGKYFVLISKSSDGYILEEYGQNWLAYADEVSDVNDN